ncbi:6-pyruvoyl trahydropterin synthase family protein [Thalassotalea ganghwensis]
MQLFVDDLTVIDFSYVCEKRGIVGESWIVDVRLNGDLNEQSMVLDFGIVKKQIKAIIDEAVDHKLLLPIKNSCVDIQTSRHHQGHKTVDINTSVGSYYMQSPECAFAFIDNEQVSIDSVKAHLSAIIFEQLPDNVKGIELTLRAEKILGDYYHYTHGLKLHDGNCQRIAHGHRSKIKLLENGQRSETLEHFWCQRWEDIYIASESDRVSLDDIELSEKAIFALTEQHELFAYQAPQGRFDIAVPKNKLEIVDCDSTVELLADFIARQLKKARPRNDYQVIAYEGVAKGAIADA